MPAKPATWRCPCGHRNAIDAPHCSKCGAVRPFKRAGLHPLDCPACDNYVYATVASLERFGLPSCPCGAEYAPREVELAELLAVDCGAVRELEAEVSSVLRGQEGKAGHGRALGVNVVYTPLNVRKGWNDPHELAMSRIVARRRHDARERRVSALKPVQPTIPF